MSIPDILSKIIGGLTIAALIGSIVFAFTMAVLAWRVKK